MNRSRPIRFHRNGAILIVVTIVLLMVTLAVVGLINLSQSEWAITKARGRELVLENLIASGENTILVIAQMNRQERAALGQLADNPEWFRDQVVSSSEALESAPRFSLLPATSFSYDLPLTFGITHESAKLNLKTLLEWERQIPGAGERALLQLPGMSPQVAAAIMDWIDVDSETRSQGAEADEYLMAGALWQPPNGIPARIEELVGVLGTTWEDWFNDHLIDENEGREADLIAELHPGWSQFLTVHSRERNQTATGGPRIYLNESSLPLLYEVLLERLGKETADFVVLYRQYGPAATRVNRGRSATATPLAGDDVEIDFAVRPRFNFKSELELVGNSVVFRGSNNIWKRINSPLAADRIGWAGQLEQMMDQVTVDQRSILEGRVNIDEAPREVLLAIPTMDAITVDQILTYRYLPADGRRVHTHATWLLEQGIVDLAKMREILPYLTTGGDVFQANIVAFDPNWPMILRELVLIDGSEPSRGRLYCKDLRDSPLPFSREQLQSSRLGANTR